MLKPKKNIVLEPFDGSERGFAFTTDNQIGAYVLDPWSFTVLEALHSDEAGNLRKILLDSSETENRDEVCSNFDQTINHLKKLGLIEEVSDA
jgi:hypothetical protein